ncbi:cytochrome b561 and DOMON domain-containing protein At3g25290-like [Cornus florida]|uniref:cytochrome b561 and DOMON domain-containing protein At3g25290-like n=1 Tax=Cornus florida TaxID=4283 RepID=UPI00289D2ACE|nr:cytochrome b561 and DOMON domain-containing protein At3g25290-like [Cornus florida]
MSSCQFSTGVFILVLFSTISTIAHTHPCSQEFYNLASRRNINHCKKLNPLGAEFGWEYHQGSSNITILFAAKLESEVGWLAWGVNPQDKPQMVGTRAIIGIKQPNGSRIINTYNITGDTKLGCRLLPTDIDLEVRRMKFEYFSRNQYYAINATLVLPSAYNMSRLNIVWQVGHASSGTQPLMHPATIQHLDSSETIDLNSGQGTRSIGEHPMHLRKVHGILNIVGWGTLMPIGVIVARYFRTFPVPINWWFRLHIFFEIVGYTLGTVGWIIGLCLGHVSEYYTFRTHRILATSIFTFTTLQMVALRLRPRATDDYRKYWDMYHHFLGYALLALISVNIFHGIAILKPQNNWKWIYIGLLGILLSITLVMEIYTWVAFARKNKRTNTTPTNTDQGKTCDPWVALVRKNKRTNTTPTNKDQEKTSGR